MSIGGGSSGECGLRRDKQKVQAAYDCPRIVEAGSRRKEVKQVRF
jgi:hypothetical protein